tara:strand:- start:93 stop:548 length:456 start_codon:yes stop_codon:yes gene_type:complete
MKCPQCSNSDSKVIDSRTVQKSFSIRRRRECLKCNYRYTTYEYVSEVPIMVIKRNGSREEYDRSKLEKSLRIAFKKRPVSVEKIHKVIEKIEDNLGRQTNFEVKSIEIGELVIKIIKDIDDVAFVRFASVYRNFKDISEFEDEINILKRKK